MPPDSSCMRAVRPGHRTRDIEGEEHRKILIAPPDDTRQHIQRDKAKSRAWLPWRSHGCDHGLRSHKIGPDGSVQEIGDLSPKTAQRRKPKSVSTRQWTGRR